MNDEFIDKMMRKMDETFQEVEGRFNEFQEDFGQQFGSQIGDQFSRFPVDVEETDTSIVVQADLPGVEKDHINVKASSSTVTIDASDEQEVREEGKNYLRQERHAKNQRRHVQLPVEVDPDSAEANYTNGVLTVTLTKTENGSGEDVEVK